MSTVRPDGSATAGRADATLAALLVVAAAALRLPALGPESLWLDDVWISLVHRVSDPGDVWRIGLTAPGFASLLKGWFAVVGFSEVAAQALPFVAGIVTPAVVYLVARRFELRQVAAALAGLLLVVSPVHVTYSTRVKQFTPAALAVTVVLWLAWRAARRPADHARWAAVVAGAVLTTMLSTSALPAVAAILVGAAAAGISTPSAGDDRGRLAGRVAPAAWVAGYLAFAVAWGTAAAARIPDALHGYWAGRYLEGWGDVWRIARRFAAGLVGVSHAVAIVGLLLLVAVGLALAVVRRRPFVLIAFGGPLAGAALLALLGTAPLGTGRTDVYLYPTLALLLAWTVDRLDTRRWGAPVAVVALLASAVPPPVAAYPQEQMAPLVAVLERELRPADEVVLTSSTRYGTALYGRWFTGIEPDRTATGFRPVLGDRRLRPAPGGTDMTPLRDRVRDAAPEARIWLFTTIVSDEQAERIRTVLRDEGCTLEREWRRPGAVLEAWSGCTTAS